MTQQFPNAIMRLNDECCFQKGVFRKRRGGAEGVKYSIIEGLRSTRLTFNRTMSFLHQTFMCSRGFKIPFRYSVYRALDIN